MSATTLVSPELENTLEPRKDAEHLLPHNGNGGSQGTLPVSATAELEKLNEAELKAAIESTWKKCERFAKKEMGPLLYWLRENLRAQGSRNDLRDRDMGFGAWVQETIEISRRTADRWADEYGIKNELIKRKPRTTSGQDDQKWLDPKYIKLLEEKRRKHLRQVLPGHWVPLAEFERHEKSVKALKKHFKTTSTHEAIVKGVQYAAKAIARGRG